MAKGITTRIDKNLKDLIENISKKEGISQTEASRELWKEITGHSLFQERRNKEEKEGRDRIRSLFG